MSENKIGFALVHEICPICGKPMNEQILMNSVLSKKYAKEIENVHGKAIGYSKTACEDCSKYKDEAVMCIAIDEAKSEPNNPYRTGQVVGIRKDFQLVVDNNYKALNKQFVDTEHLYVFDYNRGKIFHIDVPINTQNEDIPNILEEYGLKESECNYIVTEYPCKIINLTYEDKIVSKENKTQDNKVFI